MKVFGQKNSRGCWSVFHLSGQEGRGVQLRIGKHKLPGGYKNPIFVNGFSYQQNEAFGVVKCFSDAAYVYAFGHDPRSSTFSVNFVGFLVDDGDNLIKGVNRAYQAGRLYNSGAYVRMTVNNTVLRGYCVGMSSSTMDAHTNLQQFTFRMISPEVQL